MNISLTVMTLNLRRDGLPDGANAWQHRKHVCIDVIKKYSPVIVCTQEGLKSQLEDLEQGLPGYEQFGNPRNGPGDPVDQHCTILYDADKVEKMEGGTFWLSDSPSVPGSRAWGSKVPSIVTWVTFLIKGVELPGFCFQVLNTHLDCTNSRARLRGACLAWQHIETLPPSVPVIFCGDFCADKASRPGRFLLGFSREQGLAGDMRDAWAAARHRQNAHLSYTYHGFKGTRRGVLDIMKAVFRVVFLCWERVNQELHHDWILFRGRPLTPVHCEVVDDHIQGRYPSDHFPVFVQFLLPRNVRLQEQTSR